MTGVVAVVTDSPACLEAELAQRLGARVPGLRSMRIVEVGPVIAAAHRPGLLGVAVASG